MTRDETTISFNGGPQVPLSVAHAALDAMRTVKSNTAQTDLEDDALGGRDPTNEGIAADRLRSLVQRIERLNGERDALGSDIKDIYVESKSAGFDPKVIRRLVADRKKEPADVEEAETLLDLYRRALGM